MRATEKTPKECKINSTTLVQDKQAFLNHTTTLHSYVQSELIRICRLNASSLPLHSESIPISPKKNEISQLRLARLPLSPIMRARDLVQANERLTRSQRKPSFVFPIHGSRSTTVSYAVVDRGRIVPNKRSPSLLRRSETPDPKNFFLARMRPRHANTSLISSRRRKNRRAN